MTDKTDLPIKVNDRALEMLMRDVLDGMMEFTLDSAFTDNKMGFEILKIKSEQFSNHKCKEQPKESDTRSAVIIPFPHTQL